MKNEAVTGHPLVTLAGWSPDRLPVAARPLLEDPLNELLFSAASLWEIVIKRGLGRSDFQVDARVLRRGLLDNGYQELTIIATIIRYPSIDDGVQPFCYLP